MWDHPKISVAMPVFNGGDYFAQALQSALDQTYDNIEIVIVDDGSTDGGQTEAIARRFGSPKIIFLRQENQGVGGALNTAIGHMTGDIFCWLSHDDLYLPEKLEQQVAFYQDLGRENAVLFSDYYLIDRDGNSISEIKLDHERLRQRPLLGLLNACVNGCTIFMPLEILRESGGFDGALKHTQDYDLWNRILGRYDFFHQPRTLIKSRMHAGQDSRKPEAIVEGDELWVRIIEARSVSERAGLFGSTRKFFVEMGDFLGQTPYARAARHARNRAEQVISQTLVSVVIPFSNQIEATLAAARSVLDQTHGNLELVLIDHGTTEPLTEISALHTSEPRIRLISQSNHGLSSARNRGMRTAAGEYIAFLDPEDRFAPDKIETQLTAMQHSGVLFSHTSYEVLLPQWRADIGRIGSGVFTGHVYPRILSGCPIAISTVMLHRSLVDCGYGFAAAEPDAASEAMLWIALAHTCELLGLDSPLSTITWSTDRTVLSLDATLEAYEAVHRHLTEHPIHRRNTAELASLGDAAREFADICRKLPERERQTMLTERIVDLAFATG